MSTDALKGESHYNHIEKIRHLALPESMHYLFVDNQCFL